MHGSGQRARRRSEGGGKGRQGGGLVSTDVGVGCGGRRKASEEWVAVGGGERKRGVGLRDRGGAGSSAAAAKCEVWAHGKEEGVDEMLFACGKRNS